MKRSLAIAMGWMCLAGMGRAEPDVLTQAEQALRDRLPEVAVEKLKGMLAEQPEQSSRTAAERMLAQALLEAGAAEQALEYLRYPADEQEWLWKAEALTALDRWSEALPAYQEVAENGGPELHVASTLGVAEASRMLGHPGAAEKTLEELVAKTPAAIAQLRLVEMYLEAGQTVAARHLLDQVAPKTPEETKWKACLDGRLLLAEDQAAPALQELEELGRDPRGMTPALLAAATVGMTQARIILNGLEVADNVLEDYLWRNPESPYAEDTFRRLDGIYAAEENASPAQLEAWEGQGPARRAALARYYEAKYWQRTHRAEKAIRAFTDFIKRYPQHELTEDAWMQLGQLFLEEGRVSVAITAFEGAERRSRNAEERARAESAKASAYYAQGEYLLAALTFRDAAKRAPEAWMQSTYNAALAWLRLGNYNEFLEDYRALSGRYPEAPQRRELLLEEGLLQARSHDARARQSLETFIRDFPDNARVGEARLALAELAYAGGEMDRAGGLLLAAYHGDVSDQTVEQADYLAVFVADAPGKRDEERVLKLGEQFLTKHPASALRAGVRMKMGEVYFRREDFGNAQTQFETLAEEAPGDPLTDKALILAGQSSVRSMNVKGMDHALELYGRVANGNGPLRLYARQEQALLEAQQGKNKDAVIIYDDILRSNPDTELRLAALCGKADCLVAGEGATPETLKAAAELYDQVASDPDATAPWRNQALYKKATKCLERAQQSDQALTALYDVLNVPAPGGAHAVPDFFWYEKAGYDAADLLEARSQWPGAISVLEKISQAGGPRAEEAKKRAEEIRLAHFVWD